MTNRIKLRVLMAKHDVSSREVAQILGRSQVTVQAWTCRNDKDIPDHSLEVLEMRLKSK